MASHRSRNTVTHKDGQQKSSFTIRIPTNYIRFEHHLKLAKRIKKKNYSWVVPYILKLR